ALLASLTRWGRRLRAGFATLGLLTASAVLVHLSGGYVEFHFHFFITVALIALYEDWTAFLLAISYVVLEHGVLGASPPRRSTTTRMASPIPGSGPAFMACSSSAPAPPTWPPGGSMS